MMIPIRGNRVMAGVSEKIREAYLTELLEKYNTFLSPEEPHLFSEENYIVFAKYIKTLRPDYCNVVTASKRQEHNLLSEVCNVEYWENYFAYDMAYCHVNTQNPKIDHLFFYLQGRDRDFRLQFNDLLEENNLLCRGITNLHKRITMNPDFYVMNFDLDKSYPPNLFHIKDQYPLYSCFLHIVTTNTIKYMSHDEKFYRAIFNHKPFLGLACKGWHTRVEDMGFLLPDFIDYSFDSCNTIEDRLKGIIENLKSLSKLSIEELNELYMDYSHIWEHNYNRVWDMVKSREGVSNICLQHPHYNNLVTSVEERRQ